MVFLGHWAGHKPSEFGALRTSTINFVKKLYTMENERLLGNFDPETSGNDELDNALSFAFEEEHPNPASDPLQVGLSQFDLMKPSPVSCLRE